MTDADDDRKQDHALPEGSSREPELPEELEHYAEEPVKRSGFASRMLTWAKDRLGYGDRRQDRPSVRDCVFLFDFEDTFPDNPRGDQQAREFVEDLASKVREPVVPVPRGLTMVIPMESDELEMLDLTGKRK